MARADLHIVCKNPECGAEVSPYITECPYCGARLRKRAPKLDRGRPRERRFSRMPSPSLGRLRSGEIPGIRADAPPYATAALVIVTCVVWIMTRAALAIDPGQLVVAGPLHGEWWRVVSSQFTYFYTDASSATGTGVYQFSCLFAVALFGTLLERRHGPWIVIGLFLLGGAGGAVLASAADTQALVVGGNGGALALLCAWAVPDLLARRTGLDYEGDLLGTAVIAIVLLALPIARPEASALAGGAGVVAGYLCGLALARGRRT